MSDISVRFSSGGEADGPFYLTNGPGWGRVIEWAASEEAGQYHALRRLIGQGAVKDTEKLGIDLAGACEAAPGKIRGVLEEMAEKVGVGDAGESAEIVS